MKKYEFKKEVNNSTDNFANFSDIYNEFNFYQNEAYKILIEFHRICEKNGINYVLAFGSLIGIVRDGGQIPWDYDIDVIVPFCEKEKMIKSLNNDLDKSFYYYSIDNNDACRHMIMRIAPNKFKSEHLHLDIFFAIGTPNNIADIEKMSKRIKEISNIRFYKKVKIFEYSDWKIKKIVKILLMRIKYLRCNLTKLMKEYYSLCNKYDVFKSKINITADTISGNFLLDSKKLWDIIKIKDDNGHQFNIPKDYDTILKAIYGNYEEILPLKVRMKEMMNYYHILHKYYYELYKKTNKGSEK